MAEALPFEDVRRLLERARSLNDAREYASLLGHLDAIPEAERFREPELAFLYADVLRRVGRGEEARDVLDRLAPVAGRRGNDRLHRRRLNLLGTLHFEQGRLGEARLAWLRQLEDASAAGDDEFVARANNNLGILATLSTEWEVALAHYARAVAAYQRLGYHRGLGQSHQNLAITYREMGFPAEADEHFGRAVRFAWEESEDEVARAEQERALLHLLEEDPALAEVTARRALSRYRRLSDPAGEGEVERVLGLITLAAAEWERSRSHLSRALELAERTHAALLEAEVLTALAALEESAGSSTEAAKLESRARARFTEIGAGDWGRQVGAHARRLAGRGAPPTAL